MYFFRVKLVCMGQILDFFRSDLSTFWLTEPKCTKKITDLSHGANLTHFAAKPDTSEIHTGEIEVSTNCQ